MMFIRPLLTAAALLTGLVSASPLQADQLEPRVPFCESRNSILLQIRRSPQASAFCSSFLDIRPPYTTTTVTRTIRTLTTRPVSVSTTLATGTLTSQPPDTTVVTEQTELITESPSATETLTITEPLVEVTTLTLTEVLTNTEFYPSFVETLTSTERLLFTETTTSSETLTTTTTQTNDGGAPAGGDQPQRRARATPVAAFDRRLLAPSVILTARAVVSSACSCVVKPPVTRTITRFASVTSTSIRPPTSTRTVLTTITTVLPQVSISSTVSKTSTVTAATAFSTTSTTLTTPTQSTSSTTTTSPFLLELPTPATTETTTTTSETTTTTTTTTGAATQTVSVNYVDRCAVRGETPDLSTSFLYSPGVTAAACGNECARDARCKSWTWQSSNGVCQMFSVNLFRAGFVASEEGSVAGYDASCAVPATVRSNPSCAVQGYGELPGTLAPLFVVQGLFKGCSDACYANAECRSWSVNTETEECSLYGVNVASYLTQDGFLSQSYSDRSCIPPPDVCERVGQTSVTGVSKFNGITGFSSAATCAAACKADPTCVSYSYQGLIQFSGRNCFFYSVKVASLDIEPSTCQSCSPIRFSDAGCALPPTIDAACGTAAINIRPPDLTIPSITLQACNDECSAREDCQTFIYQTTFNRGCLLFNQPIDAVVALSAGASTKAYSKGCPSPASIEQVCSTQGFVPTPAQASLASLTSVTSFSDCAVACQNEAACLSYWFQADPQVCTLLSDTAANSGFFPNTFNVASARWSDKSCGLPSSSFCNYKATSAYTGSFRNERRVAADQDSLANCDDTCRRDSQCRSFVFYIQGTVAVCRTFALNAAQLVVPGTESATGIYSINNRVNCGRIPSDVASLEPICGPPMASRPFTNPFQVDVYAPDAATGFQQCQSRCQNFEDCLSYAGSLRPAEYLCYLWRESPVVGLLTGGISYNSAARFPAFFDRECPIAPTPDP